MPQEKAKIPVWELGILTMVIGACLTGAVAWGKATTDIDNLKYSQSQMVQEFTDFKKEYREDFKDFKDQMIQIVKKGQ